MAFLITPKGDMTKVLPESGESFTLEELQKHVEGPIEIVPGSDDGTTLALVNEEGKLMGKQSNLSASIKFDQHLVGNCLILTATEMGE